MFSDAAVFVPSRVLVRCALWLGYLCETPGTLILLLPKYITEPLLLCGVEPLLRDPLLELDETFTFRFTGSPLLPSSLEWMDC